MFSGHIAQTSPLTYQKRAIPDFDQERLLGPLSWTQMMLIKLNDKGVRAYMASGRTHYRNALDWQSRTGRIVKYSRNGSIAYVVWNGRSSYDRVSVDVIEPVTSLAP